MTIRVVSTHILDQILTLIVISRTLFMWVCLAQECTITSSHRTRESQTTKLIVTFKLGALFRLTFAVWVCVLLLC